MDDEKLDAPMDLEIVRADFDKTKSICAVYLNNFRIVGGKPWGGATTIKKFSGVTIRELARAIPALREELGLDYLGKSLTPKAAGQDNEHDERN